MSGDPNTSRPILPSFTAGYTAPRTLATLFPRDPDVVGHLPAEGLNPRCDGGHCRAARRLAPALPCLLPHGCGVAHAGRAPVGRGAGAASHLEPCAPGCLDCQHGPDTPTGSALAALLENCNARRDVIALADRMGLDTYDAEVIP